MRRVEFLVPDSIVGNPSNPAPAPPDERAHALTFDRAMPDGGYGWWYIDALSDNGRHAITLIAFIGSVFSPYYAAAHARRATPPINHCALNVAVYGPGARWAMTERGASAVQRHTHALRIGPSALCWDGTSLVITIDEICAPLPRRLRGTVVVRPRALTGACFALDAAGRHTWSPIAPRADVSVDLQHPALRWRGLGYLDHNVGVEPLQSAFARWHWSRLVGASHTAILYETTPRTDTPDAPGRVLALRADDDGTLTGFEPPPPAALPRGLWGVTRGTRADRPARLLHTLEDAPFYLRSVIDSQMAGIAGPAMHESLDLDRFRQPWVRMLLPARMPRRA